MTPGELYDMMILLRSIDESLRRLVEYTASLKPMVSITAEADSLEALTAAIEKAVDQRLEGPA